jgi:hypothetical protein
MFIGAEDRMLGPLVWVHLVMYRPVLLPDRAIADVVADVEELAGLMADMIAVDGPQSPEATAAANRVLDECCLFIQRWGVDVGCLDTGRPTAFRGDVVRLQMRLDAIASRLVPDADLEVGQLAS